jgi:hypothetical protein
VSEGGREGGKDEKERKKERERERRKERKKRLKIEFELQLKHVGHPNKTPGVNWNKLICVMNKSQYACWIKEQTLCVCNEEKMNQLGKKDIRDGYTYDIRVVKQNLWGFDLV